MWLCLCVPVVLFLCVQCELITETNQGELGSHDDLESEKKFPNQETTITKENFVDDNKAETPVKTSSNNTKENRTKSECLVDETGDVNCSDKTVLNEITTSSTVGTTKKKRKKKKVIKTFLRKNENSTSASSTLSSEDLTTVLSDLTIVETSAPFRKVLTTIKDSTSTSSFSSPVTKAENSSSISSTSSSSSYTSSTTDLITTSAPETTFYCQNCTTSTPDEEEEETPSIFQAFNLNYLYCLFLLIPLTGVFIGLYYYCKRKKKSREEDTGEFITRMKKEDNF